MTNDHYERSPIKRTIDELIKECPEHSDVKEMNPQSNKTKGKTKKKATYGQTRKPFINVPLDHILLDELHLMLRVTDVLTDNLIREVMERDRRNGSSKALKGEFLNKLVKAIQDCGISFSVWERSDGDGRGNGKYDWTSLMGADKKKMLSNLPDKLQEILHPDTADTVIKIWKVRPQFQRHLSNYRIPCLITNCTVVYSLSVLLFGNP